MHLKNLVKNLVSKLLEALDPLALCLWMHFIDVAS